MIENIKIDKANLSKTELEMLEFLVAKSKGYPQKDEIYWFLTDSGEIESTEWHGDPDDKDTYEIGNCFKTKEDAENAKNKMIILTRIKRLAKDYIDGDKNPDAYVYIDLNDKQIHPAINKSKVYIPDVKVSSGILFNEFKKMISDDDIKTLLNFLI